MVLASKGRSTLGQKTGTQYAHSYTGFCCFNLPTSDYLAQHAITSAKLSWATRRHAA